MYHLITDGAYSSTNALGCAAFVILKDGDVIIADTAEDETVGKAVEVINVKNKNVILVDKLHIK